MSTLKFSGKTIKRYSEKKHQQGGNDERKHNLCIKD